MRSLFPWKDFRAELHVADGGRRAAVPALPQVPDRAGVTSAPEWGIDARL